MDSINSKILGFVCLYLFEGSTYYDRDGILWKKINDEIIGFPAVQLKDYRIVWYHELSDKSLIDTRYYNLDGSKIEKNGR